MRRLRTMIFLGILSFCSLSLFADDSSKVIQNATSGCCGPGGCCPGGKCGPR